MQDEENKATGALMFRLPETVSWSLNIGETEWHGDTLQEFTQALDAVPRGTGVTISVSCLVELGPV